MINLPKTTRTDRMAAAPNESRDIAAAADVYTAQDVVSAAHDPPAQELLAPPPAESPSPARTFDQALRDGTIPIYVDQPADLAVDDAAPAVDPDAERAAWQQLITFIEKHKDPGTTVSMVDPATFAKGLT